MNSIALSQSIKVRGGESDSFYRKTARYTQRSHRLNCGRMSVESLWPHSLCNRRTECCFTRPPIEVLFAQLLQTLMASMMLCSSTKEAKRLNQQTPTSWCRLMVNCGRRLFLRDSWRARSES